MNILRIARELHYLLSLECSIWSGYFFFACTESAKVYLISSTLVFLVEIIALADTLSPTWYPYYGTWFIGLVVEICLIIFPNLFSSPTNSAFDYVLITIQAARILNFVALPIVYFYFRGDEKAHDTNDAERQSLLQKNTVLSSSESSTLNGNGYGTTDDATSQDAQDVDVSDAASVTSEDSYLERQRKSKEAVAKRLQEDGNWWTYIKGFSVGLKLQSYNAIEIFMLTTC